MRKWTLFIICLCFVVYLFNSKDMIIPKEAHNLVGNIPIVEMIDDGPNYVNNTEIKYCDETWPMFTCRLKFGYSGAVSNRIAQGKLLGSCEEAKEVQKENLDFCIEQEKEMMKQVIGEVGRYNLDYWIKKCHETHQYIPECGEDFKK